MIEGNGELAVLRGSPTWARVEWERITRDEGTPFVKPGRVTLDFDSILVEAESEKKEQAAPNWKHGFGCHPLLVFLEQTGEAFAGKLRPGNAGANTGPDHV